MSVEENISTVRRYFDGCSSGDLEVLLSTLTVDVVHYFLPPRFPPIRGAEHLAHYWRKYKQVLDPVWNIDRIIGQDDQVVSEWSCLWTPSGTARRIMIRGSEWYDLREGRIAEVRAYFEFDDKRDVELADFPYDQRGYLTPQQ